MPGGCAQTLQRGCLFYLFGDEVSRMSIMSGLLCAFQHPIRQTRPCTDTLGVSAFAVTACQWAGRSFPATVFLSGVGLGLVYGCLSSLCALVVGTFGVTLVLCVQNGMIVRPICFGSCWRRPSRGDSLRASKSTSAHCNPAVASRSWRSACGLPIYPSLEPRYNISALKTILCCSVSGRPVVTGYCKAFRCGVHSGP